MCVFRQVPQYARRRERMWLRRHSAKAAATDRDDSPEWVGVAKIFLRYPLRQYDRLWLRENQDGISSHEGEPYDVEEIRINDQDSLRELPIAYGHRLPLRRNASHCGDFGQLFFHQGRERDWSPGRLFLGATGRVRGHFDPIEVRTSGNPSVVGEV